VEASTEQFEVDLALRRRVQTLLRGEGPAAL
jgi:hypothetical protein